MVGLREKIELINAQDQEAGDNAQRRQPADKLPVGPSGRVEKQ